VDGYSVSLVPRTPQVADWVRSLVEAATHVDRVAPLSEDALLHIRPISREESLSEAATRPADGTQPQQFLMNSGDGALVGYAHLDPPDEQAPDNDLSGELVIHPDHRRLGYGSLLLSHLISRAEARGLRVWAHGDLPAAAALARTARMPRVRALWQMRVPASMVPEDATAMPAGVTLRTFSPGSDEADWLAVNRRAFAHHPEQGKWTMDDLLVREAEPWFDPDGFFLAERDGRLAGFHWTKVHPDGGADGGPIGEVYVVGIDPDQQGGGLGRALTMVGLTYLRRRGLSEIMLYVDEDNTAAVKMYTRLGFTRWSTDAMYRSSGALYLAPRPVHSSKAGRRSPRRSREPRRKVRSHRAPRRREHEDLPAWESCSPPSTGRSPPRPSGYVATPFLRMTHRGHSQTTLRYVLPGFPITIP
jgi:mycothiol synthase